MADALALLALLIGLELVLGLDNVLVIAIFVGRLPVEQRQKARILGLALAMVARIVMLAVVVTLTSVTTPLIWNFLCAISFSWPADFFLFTKRSRKFTIPFPWKAIMMEPAAVVSALKPLSLHR